jgi:16S rRNA (guanine966-N2)-methyltransferase
VARASDRGEVRIIGGHWRSRRLRFPASAGLRPTPDRVRETLFNWLAPALPGARCLDLFAGSGALGFEALSRGAASAVLVERDPNALAALRQNAEALAATGARIVPGEALAYLRGPVEQFDVVFLDPPFGPSGEAGLLEPCVALLHGRGWLSPGGRAYLETRRATPPELPPGWQLEHSRQAGQVRYHLARTPPTTQA